MPPRGYAWAKSVQGDELLGANMDADPFNVIVLTAVIGAVFFYVLYGVIRAATRDGIIAARRQAEEDGALRDGAKPGRTVETVENGR